MPKPTLKVGIAVAVTLLVVGLFFVVGLPFNIASLISGMGTQQTPAQLSAQDEVVGTGATASPGDDVLVNYTGKLQDGTVFDSSVGKQPISFTLGSGQVIPGWDQGIVGMKEGGKRLLIIPPGLAYGASSNGPIPANSTLIFEVELVKVGPAASGTPVLEGPAAN